LVEFIVTGESLMVHALHSQEAVRQRSNQPRIPRRRNHRNSPAAATIASAPRGNGDDAAPTLHPPLSDEALLPGLTSDPPPSLAGASASTPSPSSEAPALSPLLAAAAADIPVIP
jgi:hypothetical protein